MSMSGEPASTKAGVMSNPLSAFKQGRRRRAGLRAVRLWAWLAEVLGCPPGKVIDAHRIATQMENWQARNHAAVKRPD